MSWRMYAHWVDKKHGCIQSPSPIRLHQMTKIVYRQTLTNFRDREGII